MDEVLFELILKGRKNGKAETESVREEAMNQTLGGDICGST